MPPRYAYWTILVDDQPTAFRSGSQEELMPTFKRLQQKHPSAKMMWWQNGKLWNSRIDAQEAMLARGEIGRRSDPRQDDRRRPFRSSGDRPSERAPGPRERREERNPSGKLDWKPKGEAAVRSDRPERPKFAAGGRESRGSAKRETRPEWKPKGSFTPERPKFAAGGRESRASSKREARPEWKPKGSFTPERQKFAAEDRGPRRSAEREGGPEKRKWVPKAEYKKSLGIEVKKDKNWRPGGEHKDPRQKYKDAKKAKWTKFKKNIRARSDAKPKKREQ
jgi:hypothetical protein